MAEDGMEEFLGGATVTAREDHTMSEQDDNRQAQSEALGRALSEAMDGDVLHPATKDQPQLGTWISVRDELPKENHYPLLVAVKTAKPGVSVYATAWYSRLRHIWHAYPADAEFKLHDVTHWMELDFIPPPEETR